MTVKEFEKNYYGKYFFIIDDELACTGSMLCDGCYFAGSGSRCELYEFTDKFKKELPEGIYLTKDVL